MVVNTSIHTVRVVAWIMFLLLFLGAGAALNAFAQGGAPSQPQNPSQGDTSQESGGGGSGGSGDASQTGTESLGQPGEKSSPAPKTTESAATPIRVQTASGEADTAREGSAAQASPSAQRRGTTTGGQTGAAGARGLITAAMRSCLEGTLGRDRSAAILDQNFLPTPDETAKANACFRETPQHEYATSALPRGTSACLARVFGRRWPRSGKPLLVGDLDELRRARACFGIPDTPLAPLPILTLPKATLECLNAAVGADALSRIAAGDAEPTDDQREKSRACFQKLEQRQLDILPRPPEEVPFLSAEAPTIAVEKIETVDEPELGAKAVPRVVLSGAAPAGALVDLYLFSVNPIVVSLATDANGVWQYRLDQPVTEGDHRGYAVVKLSGREPVRSVVFPFAVARAAETDTRQGGLIVRSEEEQFAGQARGFLTSSGLVIAAGIVLLLLLAPTVLRRFREER